MIKRISTNDPRSVSAQKEGERRVYGTCVESQSSDCCLFFSVGALTEKSRPPLTRLNLNMKCVAACRRGNENEKGRNTTTV